MKIEPKRVSFFQKPLKTTKKTPQTGRFMMEWQSGFVPRPPANRMVSVYREALTNLYPRLRRNSNSFSLRWRILSLQQWNSAANPKTTFPV
jgi:hypothetical protein